MLQCGCVVTLYCCDVVVLNRRTVVLLYTVRGFEWWLLTFSHCCCWRLFLVVHHCCWCMFLFLVVDVVGNGCCWSRWLLGGCRHAAEPNRFARDSSLQQKAWDFFGFFHKPTNDWFQWFKQNESATKIVSDHILPSLICGEFHPTPLDLGPWAHLGSDFFCRLLFFHSAPGVGALSAWKEGWQMLDGKWQMTWIIHDNPVILTTNDVDVPWWHWRWWWALSSWVIRDCDT